MHRLDLGLYSHPKEVFFLRNEVRTHVNSKGEIPLSEASCRTASPAHSRLSYSGLLSWHMRENVQEDILASRADVHHYWSTVCRAKMLRGLGNLLGKDEPEHPNFGLLGGKRSGERKRMLRGLEKFLSKDGPQHPSFGHLTEREAEKGSGC